MLNQRKSIRLQSYDYASGGAYFITLVTWKRLHLFGEITTGEMHLNPCGETVQDQWLRSAEIRSEIILDEFIVMPNHFHGIVMIQDNHSSLHKGDRPVAPTGVNLPTGPGVKTLGALVAGFKSAATREINQSRKTPKAPVWQRNFYERVIRNERELDAIREYIQNNPLNWESDSENTHNRR